MFQAAFAIEQALAEAALVDAAIGHRQPSLTVEQAGREATAVAAAVGALPGAMAVQQAMLEAAGVPGAVVVVQPALAFQAPVHQLAAIARAVRQARIGREQRFALAAGGEQDDQGGAERETWRGEACGVPDEWFGPRVEGRQCGGKIVAWQ